MKERISAFLRSENKTSAQFAEEIGVQPSGISHILSGRNKPSLDFVVKMLETYPSLSVEWLLFGKGQMYREKTLAELFNSEINPMPEQKETATIKADDGDLIREKNGIIVSDQVAGNKNGCLKINRIVWFYDDNTFREYFPGNGN